MLSTTKSSATLDKIEVSEIGRRCLFPFLFFLHRFLFWYRNDICKLPRLRKMASVGRVQYCLIGPENKLASSFNRQPGIPRGRLAFVGFNFDNFIRTDEL